MLIHAARKRLICRVCRHLQYALRPLTISSLCNTSHVCIGPDLGPIAHLSRRGRSGPAFGVVTLLGHIGRHTTQSSSFHFVCVYCPICGFDPLYSASWASSPLVAEETLVDLSHLWLLYPHISDKSPSDLPLRLVGPRSPLYEGGGN